MTNLNVTLPENFIDARDAVLQAFQSGKRILEGPFDNELVRQISSVHSYHIEDQSEVERYGNLNLVVTYHKPVISGGMSFVEIPKTRKLYLLSTAGDHMWTVRTKLKIWDNNYPSTVALDLETREVFFFGIKASVIELLHFGTLTEDQMAQIYSELNEREPFSIRIDEGAMFDYIDELQGLAHLRNNLYIEFHCSVSLRLDMQKSDDLGIE